MVVRRSSVMDWDLEQALARSRQRLDDAHQAWLIHEALAATPAQPGWRDQALVQVGGWLIGIGHRLQLVGGCTATPTMTRTPPTSGQPGGK